ncbi:MAG: CHAD domain-containing protein [Planctomycetota bacterium]
MTPAHSIEHEFKLIGDHGIENDAVRRAAARCGIALRTARTLRHVDTYLDTPDLTLARRGRGLRLREQGRSRSLQLKHELGNDAGLREREEYAVPWDGSLPRRAAELPTALRSRIAPLIGDESLQPIAILRTLRRRLIGTANADRAEIALDDVEVSSPDGSVVGTFHECEIELAEGQTPAPWAKLARRLRDHGLRDADDNKLTRSLAMLGVEARWPASERIEEDVPLHEAARRCVAASLRRMQEAEVALHTKATKKHVHALRVACRRGRAALSIFEEVLPKKLERHLRRIFRDTAHSLDGLRDLDVAVDGMRALAAELPDDLANTAKSLRRRLASTRTNVVAKALSELDSRKRSKRITRCAGALATPRLRQNEPLREHATKAILRAATAVIERSRGELDDEALHRLRLAQKRLRYSAEHLGALFGPDLSRFVERLAHLQDLGGRYRDAIAAIERFRALSKANGLRLRTFAMTLGALMGCAHRHAIATRAELDTALLDLERDDLLVLLRAIVETRR